MRKGQILSICLILVLTALAACSPKTAPAPAAAPAAPAKAAWDKLVANAKQEGKVVLFTTGGSDLHTALVKIAKAQGISAEVSPARPPEFSVKVYAERRAGLYLEDMYITGTYPMLTEYKPAGILEPLDSMLILPDLTDPKLIKKVWYQERFPWFDKDHYILYSELDPGPPLTINTNMVKEGEIKSYRDLLDPKWQGKLAVGDPTIPGAAQQSLAVMLGFLGEDFMRELVVRKPIIMRDQHQQLEWLAQGKVPIAVAPQSESVAEFAKVGAPIKVVVPQEGTWLWSSGSGVMMLNNAPHPNATKVFLNLLLSKEGQEEFSRAGGYHSLRLDVSTTHLPPWDMRQPGIKYIDAYSEEAQLRQGDLRKLAMAIFKPLVK